MAKKVTVVVEIDSAYPVYSILGDVAFMDEDDHDRRLGDKIKVPLSKLRKWERAIKKYNKVQSEIADKITRMYRLVNE
ncbi:MAG: hypothetical protein ACXABY_00735 [Candidatus Thorarchaeota archaeon]|jgi:hypothetical protein